MKVGLRIDVDTFRGTARGVTPLSGLLANRSIQASFFFSVGPDNMGRHILRLIRPRFLAKMVRSRAGGLYGWDIIFRGTFWPGTIIGERLPDIIQSVRASGHETGLHAWDHHAWQTRVMKMSEEKIRESMKKGFELLSEITGVPCASAAPGWVCSEEALTAKESFPFRYNSDCRGRSIFFPVVNGVRMKQPQIPVTLPTYDELIGRNGITRDNYNDHMFSLLRPDAINVLAVHAEVEGLSCFELFRDFLDKGQTKGIEFVSLGNILPESSLIEDGSVIQGVIPGREGTVALQGAATPDIGSCGNES